MPRQVLVCVADERLERVTHYGEDDDKPIANPVVLLREEFDDWAILFNPDATLGFSGFGLNPTGVYVWKLLDGSTASMISLRISVTMLTTYPRRGRSYWGIC